MVLVKEAINVISLNIYMYCNVTGWYLSMKPEHSFLRKLTNVKKMPEIYESRFQMENREKGLRTLGFVLVRFSVFDFSPLF
jgi:hypothetical protein